MNPKRSVHLDFHTMPGIYDVGRDFDADEFAQTLKEAHVEYITVFARCNLGFAYYPTRIGVPHPGLKRDLLGGMVKACHKQDIQVAAYFNAGIDHEHALRHRDWCKLDKEGHVYHCKRMGSAFRNLCLNTPYQRYLIGMIREVLGKYPVDGIFLDCFDLSPCYGKECLDGMKRMGMDPTSEEDARRYCVLATDRFLEEVKGIIRKQKRPIRLCLNGIPYRKQPTHIEIEVLPAGWWGYEYLPWVIRYARTLNKPYLTMTGRFHNSWGDFCGLRPEHSLLFDCLNSIANGGACMVGDHMHPRGKLEKGVYRLIGKVYSKIKELEPWTINAAPAAEMAIISPELKQKGPHYISQRERAAVIGATRMLMELKYQFDVSDGEGDWSRYRVIILPDHVLVDAGLGKKLAKHLKSGGVIISSAWAGLNPGKQKFALKEYKISCAGPEPFNVAFFKPAREVARDLPEMLTTIYTPGIVMKARAGARELAGLYRPYFNLRSWDGYHENMYIPPEKSAGRPALLKCGNIFHFSFPVFESYHEQAVIAYRTLVRNCLEKAFPEPMIRTAGLPSFAQVTVTQKGNRTMVHILTYVPERRGPKMQIIEDPVQVIDAQLFLRRDGHELRHVYLAPGKQPLSFASDDRYWKVVIPGISGYQMIVFEMKK